MAVKLRSTQWEATGKRQVLPRPAETTAALLDVGGPSAVGEGVFSGCILLKF